VEKGIGVGFEGVGVGVGAEDGARLRSLLGLVMSEMFSLETARGRVAGSSSASSGVEGSLLLTSRSRAKRRGEALRACCAASGVR
jgi:hypothetical protein